MSLFLDVQLEKERRKKLKEDAERELINKLIAQNANKKQSNVNIFAAKKDTHTRLVTDTDRELEILDKKLESYRIPELKSEVRDYIKDISRYALDYYSVKMTTQFIEKIIEKFLEKTPKELTKTNTTQTPIKIYEKAHKKNPLV